MGLKFGQFVDAVGMVIKKTEKKPSKSETNSERKA